MSGQPVYFPGLNGLRAIAALAVVVSHTTLALGEFGLPRHPLGSNPDGTPSGLALAGFGVSMFFSLSGFLITYLLLKEKSLQQIDVKKFYARRVLRIWPLYYLYLALCGIAWVATRTPVDGSSLLFYIFFGANIPFILSTQLPLLAHYWSLGVEEQFYAFWPWVARGKERLFVVSMLGILFGLVGAKLLLHFRKPDGLWETAIGVTRFHCMAMGGLGAYVCFHDQAFFRRAINSRLFQWMTFAVLILVCIGQFHVASVLDNELVSAFTTVFIIGQITGSSVLRLENRIFDFLGKISYGIYVLHPLLIFGLARMMKGMLPDRVIAYVGVYVAVAGATVLLAFLSYTYYEKGFLNLKKSFTVVPSVNSRYVDGNPAVEQKPTA